MGDEYWFEEGCWITELSNSADDPALSIARARLPSGGTTRWHRLHGVIERYVILSGRGVVEVGDQPPREVGEGDMVYISAMQAQRIHNPGPDDLLFLALCTPRFTPEAYEDIDPERRADHDED
ncbi:MAG: cupin domain-containing protein [Xanthomonadales bacterium]|nr:cupin domain-containing protein [Xanthomonadales bacterium]